MDKNKNFTPTESDAQWSAAGWSDTPVELTAAPKLGATISIRLDPEMARLARRAARCKGWTLSEFVRRATIKEAKLAVEGIIEPVRLTSVARAAQSATAAADSDLSTEGAQFRRSHMTGTSGTMLRSMERRRSIT
jgi:uncharacterized protein (DUF1778 family)